MPNPVCLKCGKQMGEHLGMWHCGNCNNTVPKSQPKPQPQQILIPKEFIDKLVADVVEQVKTAFKPALDDQGIQVGKMFKKFKKLEDIEKRLIALEEKDVESQNSDAQKGAGDNEGKAPDDDKPNVESAPIKDTKPKPKKGKPGSAKKS